jgi:hypothetical protein
VHIVYNQQYGDHSHPDRYRITCAWRKH